MKSVIRSLINQRKITIFIVALLMVIGMLNYVNAPKQQSPVIELGTALITTVFPGGSAEDVERLVTRVIEDELMTLEAYDEISSHSSPNHSVIFYTVKVSEDYTEDWPDLRRAMEDIQSELPEGCGKIKVDTDFMKTVGFILSLHGDAYDDATIEAYGEMIKTSLDNVYGIKNVELFGEREKELVIELDYKKMNTLSIGYDELLKTIRAQNLEIPSGHVDVGTDRITFKVNGYFDKSDAIGEIIVAMSEKTGIMTRLKDISHIYLDETTGGARVLHGQENSVLIAGYFEDKQNIIPIGDDIDKALEPIKQQLPNGLVIDKILFQPDNVRNEVGRFMMSLLQGIVLVIIVVFVGLGIRNAMVVAVAIPLSIMITMSVMGIWSVEIQQISITALIIALGMLVDNAIVVSDAIQVRIDNGEKQLNACIDGVLEVARPVLTSTLTTVCTFMPILLLKGEMGAYLRSMPIIVIISLSASYLVAVFVTPVLGFIVFRPTKRQRKSLLKSVQILSYAMKHRGMTIGLVACLLAVSLFSVRWIGLKFFPYADTDMLYINANTEQVVDIDTTEEMAKDIAMALSSTEGVKKVVSSVGEGMPKFFDTMFPAFPSIDYAQTLVIVDEETIGLNRPYENLTAIRDALQNQLDKEIIASRVEVVQLEQGEPVGAPVNIKVSGHTMDELKEAGEYVEDLLKAIPGTMNVDSDYSNQQIAYAMTLDRYRASQRGLNNYNIQSAVNILLRGREAGTLFLSEDDYPIKVTSNIASLKELENVKIKSPITGEKYLLNDLGHIALTEEQTQIKKIDGQFIVNINANVLNGYSAVEIQNQVSQQIDRSIFPLLTFEFKGESDSIQRNFSAVAVTGIAFIAIIYGVLLLQFKSFLRPVIILMTIPLSIIGSLLGLLITGISLSFTAFLGMVSLAGIVVNNAIVLIDFIDEGTARGMALKEACLAASQKRTRPILLSTITTAVGLIPLILTDNELFTPMAVTLMSGLMVSTVLTLVVVPVLTSLLTYKKKEAINPLLDSL